jgi:hypothetical protein
MNDLIAVFKMEEVSIDIRIRILQKLGRAINHEHGANVTDELVDELISILEKRNDT